MGGLVSCTKGGVTATKESDASWQFSRGHLKKINKITSWSSTTKVLKSFHGQNLQAVKKVSKHLKTDPEPERPLFWAGFHPPAQHPPARHAEVRSQISPFEPEPTKKNVFPEPGALS